MSHNSLEKTCEQCATIWQENKTKTRLYECHDTLSRMSQDCRASENETKRENVVRYSHECLQTVYIHSLHNAMRYSVFVCCPITDLAAHLTETNRGKHFIGDFLPPDELERFMETFKVCSG